MRTDEPHPIRLQDYRPPDWLVDTVELDVSLDASATRVRAALLLRPNPKAAAPAPLVLDGDGLTLVALKLDGEPLAPAHYVATPDRLSLAQPPQRPFRLEIETRVDPSANTQLMGLYRSGKTYCTQCEAEGFRRITYFPDRPDVMAIYTTRIEADITDAPVLLANGNLKESGTLPGGKPAFRGLARSVSEAVLSVRTGRRRRSPVVEDRFRTMSGRDVTLRIYVEPGKEDRCGYAMDSLKRAMRWDEQRFGREYDLDIFMIVAVSRLQHGRDGEQGPQHLQRQVHPGEPGDRDRHRLRARSKRSWRTNISTTGPATASPAATGSSSASRKASRSSATRNSPPTSARGRSSASRMCAACARISSSRMPVPSPIRCGPTLYREINNFYTATVYEKGAEVVRMLQTLLGPEQFRSGMDLYFARHDGEAATIEQFVQCFADAAGATSRSSCCGTRRPARRRSSPPAPTTRAAKTYRLDLAQTLPPTPGQPTKEPMVIPLVDRPRGAGRPRPAAAACRWTRRSNAASSP